jgi:hypothetical protein
MRPALALFAGLLAASLASAAPPVVPGTLTYQGVLLDASGDPQTGSVDLTVRVYDAISGGTLVYKQSFAGVALVDGVFSIVLGPSGLATDTPANPLTTSFETALSGDLAATGASRFLEVTVGASGALPRTQFLSVPYAFQARRAESADVAAEAGEFGGLPSEAFAEIYTHFPFDGLEPPNEDPSEGLGDVDGDGIPNFLDKDNDNDLRPDSDANELAGGINLVTPLIQSLVPSTLTTFGGSVAVSGQFFEPGLAVDLSGEPLVPQNLTATGFEVSVGWHDFSTLSLTVTRLNGQTDSEPLTFQDPPYPNHGLSVNASARLTLDAKGAQQTILGTHNGVPRARFDADGDGLPETSMAGNQDADCVAWSPIGRQVKLSDDAVNGPGGIAFFVDNNGDGLFGAAGEGVQIQASGEVESCTATFSSVRRAAGYIREDGATAFAVVAHDRDGLGGFIGSNEVVQIEPLTVVGSARADFDIDATGHAALAWHDGGSGALRVAWDRSGDGDFADTVSGNPELATLASAATLACLGAAFDSAGALAVVYAATGSPATLARDLNGDGDFADPLESTALGAAAATACDVAGGGLPGISAIHDSGGNLRLLVDRNGDTDFSDFLEDRALALASTGPFAPVAITRSDTGRTVAASRTKLFLDVEP